MASHPHLLTFDDLKAVARLGPRCSLARVEAWARKARIPYSYDARGGIWTTVDAVNAALGVGSAGSAPDEIPPDAFG
jgi:hypothetical protein